MSFAYDILRTWQHLPTYNHKHARAYALRQLITNSETWTKTTMRKSSRGRRDGKSQLITVYHFIDDSRIETQRAPFRARVIASPSARDTFNLT